MSANMQNNFQRKRGNRPAKGAKGRTITFSWVKLDINQGQSIKEWEEGGLLSELCIMMRQIGQYQASEVLANRKTIYASGFPSQFRL